MIKKYADAMRNDRLTTLKAATVLDRVTLTRLPDQSFTTISYGFGPGRSGTGTQFQSTFRDNNVNAGLPGAVKHTFRDVSQLITSVTRGKNARNMVYESAID